LSDACESTDRVKRGVTKELFSENRGFSCEEKVIYDITGNKDMEKRSSEILGVKMEIIS